MIDATIVEMARRIAAGFHPSKIILFGSAGRGQATADSDVDLLVVVSQVDNRRALRIAIRRALNDLRVPKDIVVLTEEEFEVKRRIPGTIAYPADTEGTVIYAS
jgi:predicted nucleotidyltransferase